MCIAKGVLLGILLFIGGGLSYVGIRMAIALHRAQPTLNVLAVAAHNTTFEYGLGRYTVRLFWLRSWQR